MANENQPEVISLLDDDDEPEERIVHIPTRTLADGCIEILDGEDAADADTEPEDDDDDDEAKPRATRQPSENKSKEEPSEEENASPNRRRRRRSRSRSSSALDTSEPKEHSNSSNKKQKARHENDAEEDIQVVEAPKEPLFVPVPPTAAFASNNDDDDDDVALVIGSRGINALVDFPHAREHCVRYAWDRTDPTRHCENCFCYVCDAPVTRCDAWSRHCRATHGSAYWRRRREGRDDTTTATAVTTTTSSPPRATAAGSSQHPPPSSLSSLAAKVPVRTLLEAVTRVYPAERAPPTPPFQTALRHYQQQSLAFMMDVEENETTSWNSIHHRWDKSTVETRGGWICSEVGMGKSAVVIALVAARPQPDLRTLPKLPDGRRRVKATFIMTSVSLMGQWEDECRKHAPHLNVMRYHPPSQTKRGLTKQQFFDADIIISSATFNCGLLFGLDLTRLMFHRVVMDESHLFYTRTVSANPKWAGRIPSALRWCVTATPMTSSPEELSPQCGFLGMPMDLRGDVMTKPNVLKKYMIRHTKSQQIGGSAALALPESTSRVEMVPMSADEQERYKERLTDRRQTLLSLRRMHNVHWYHLTNTILYAFTAPLVREDSSKLKALEAAILDLQSRDPNMRAVVFTQFRDCLAHVKTLVGRMKIPLYCFDGSTTSKKRDEAIRAFQSSATTGPAVFVITTLTGSVGITLTAASHVFLMEPCINPADETQAAGRIHRLGQTKAVAVTKFVYADTFESNILDLHREIEAGRIQFTAKGVKKDAVGVLLRNVR